MADKSVQDLFLNTLKSEKKTCNVFLVNGIRLVGTISAYDSYVVVILGQGMTTQMVYKHAISTISPQN